MDALLSSRRKPQYVDRIITKPPAASNPGPAAAVITPQVINKLKSIAVREHTVQGTEAWLTANAIQDRDKELQQLEEQRLYYGANISAKPHEHLEKLFSCRAVHLHGTAAAKSIMTDLKAWLQRDYDDKPLVLLLCGVPGTGKSDFGKALGRFFDALVPDDSKTGDQLLLVSMNEYREKHKLSELTQAPPGFEGCDHDSALTRYVIRLSELKPPRRGVVLLDEFDAAHSTVQEAFLSPFADFRWKDRHGVAYPVGNIAFIITTNHSCSLVPTWTRKHLHATIKELEQLQASLFDALQKKQIVSEEDQMTYIPERVLDRIKYCGGIYPWPCITDTQILQASDPGARMVESLLLEKRGKLHAKGQRLIWSDTLCAEVARHCREDSVNVRGLSGSLDKVPTIAKAEEGSDIIMRYDGTERAILVTSKRSANSLTASPPVIYKPPPPSVTIRCRFRPSTSSSGAAKDQIVAEKFSSYAGFVRELLLREIRDEIPGASLQRKRIASLTDEAIQNRYKVILTDSNGPVDPGKKLGDIATLASAPGTLLSVEGPPVEGEEDSVMEEAHGAVQQSSAPQTSGGWFGF